MISDNLSHILECIACSARAAGRLTEDIRLVAVSKTVGVDLIREATVSGQTLFGENYLQEAATKIPQLPPMTKWHFIGHLQSNKAGQAVELFDVIETVDRWKIAKSLDDHVRRTGKNPAVLVQVNIGREEQKSGVLPEETENLLRRINGETSLRVLGLMAMPPFFPDPEQSRPYFRSLRKLAHRLAPLHLFANNDRIELSMGMSNDYMVAIEEGATLVRIGTALFGSRKS